MHQVQASREDETGSDEKFPLTGIQNPIGDDIVKVTKDSNDGDISNESRNDESQNVPKDDDDDDDKNLCFDNNRLYREGKKKLVTSSDVDEFITAVDNRCKRVAIKATICWLTLALFAFIIGYKTDRLEYLDGNESLFPGIAALVLFISIVFNLIPYALPLRRRNEGVGGVLLCAFTVQAIALITDFLLFTAKVPVFIDPVMGTRVFMLRWAEWTSLAFIMTFLTEMCQHESMVVEDESNKKKKGFLHNVMNVMNYQEPKVVQNPSPPKHDLLEERLQPAFDLALSQEVSTFCGYLFPFCPEDNPIICWGRK